MWHAHVLPSTYQAPGATSPVKWNGYKWAWDFMDTYEVGDERLNTFLLEYTDKNGVLKDRNNANSYLFYAASPVKYSLNGTVGKSSEIDFIVYRFADVLTLLSEAVVRNSDVTQEAIDLSNKVRIRAGLQGYVMSDISGTQEFIDKVLLERGHELYYEGTCREDLIRHGKYVEFMLAKAERSGEVTAMADYMKLYPIPQWAINEGQGLIEQNLDY